MDNASAYGAEDCGFKSHRGCLFVLLLLTKLTSYERCTELVRHKARNSTNLLIKTVSLSVSHQSYILKMPLQSKTETPQSISRRKLLQGLHLHYRYDSMALSLTVASYQTNFGGLRQYEMVLHQFDEES